MSNIIKINCKACDEEKSMIPSKISRMSPVVVIIGWLLAIPSVIGILISIILFFASISAGSEVSTQATSDAYRAGAAIGTGLGIGFSIFMGFSSLIGGLIGYLLIMKKKVFKCTLCGSIIDRA